DGNVPKPTLIKNDGSRQGEWFHLPISRDTFKAVKQGMLRVVESQYGTGQLARIDFLRLAGKTGTAQAPPHEPHAWFAGFFPYENPRVALVVFVEHGGSGGLVAAKLVKHVLSAWKKFYAPNQIFQKPELPPVVL
ncbi:MAG: hypothetical protein HY582_03060, partial [Candidatus Omnitrophica bacterium]|nr:hypothetical protein [Candidatus Omnitrophota bacterium]